MDREGSASQFPKGRGENTLPTNHKSPWWNRIALAALVSSYSQGGLTGLFAKKGLNGGHKADDKVRERLHNPK